MMLSLTNLSVSAVCEKLLYDWDLARVSGVDKGHF